MTSRPANASSIRLEDVARRLSSLPHDKQAEFARYLDQRGISVLSLPIVPQVRPAVIPLSFAQRRLWLVDQLQPNSSQYNVPQVYALAGALDQPALERALTDLVERHEALRTTFIEAGGEPAQVVSPAPPIDLALRELAEPAARELAAAEASRPFDLARGPLFRTRLIRLSDALHWLLVTSHHIVMDEWSDAVIARELVELYDAHRSGRAPELAPIAIQYADYALWQRRWLSDDVLAQQLAHWQVALGSGDHEPVLTAELAAPAAPSHAAAAHHFRIDRALDARLRAFSARANTTLFTTVLAVFHVVLHRLSGVREIRVGSPIANRHRREIEGVVGCFANTQVLRSALGPALTFYQHLEAVKRSVAAAQSNQDLPFERLVEALAPERNLSQTPLFQVMFSWHRGLAEQAPAAGALTITQEPIAARTAKLDLVLHMTDDDTGLAGELQYRAELFTSQMMAAIAERLQRLAAAALDAPDRPLATLRWLTDAEHDRIARQWNATDADAPRAPLHACIAAWARTTPDAPAVQFETERLSYRELADRAARVAGLLAARGVRPDDRVGLCVPRSLDLVTGLVGILTCGAAYVPLDPRTPPERLRELLADAGIRCVVAPRAIADQLRTLGADILEIDDTDALAAAAPLAGLAVPPDAAAYVIYTSGSTGRPKGVVISHGAITSYAHGLLARLALPPGASMALVSTPTADLGNTVLFGALVAGGLLHVVAEDRCFDPDRIAAYLGAHGVDVLKITPSHLGGLLQAAAPGDVLPRHTLILGGEAASADLLARIRRHGRCRIVNHYGPTETTVGVLTYDAGGPETGTGASDAAGLPLGRPLPNRQAYVLDAGLLPVPPGVFGELYIGGTGVARGYLGRPDATADRFIPDPFRPGGGRLYRTGDRARYRSDGSIEFAGRTDDQIKLRGHRVEPGEIRAALLRVPGVGDAHVVLREGATTAPRLVAYLLADSPAATSISAAASRTVSIAAGPLPAGTLAEALASWLPEHMVPAEFVWLDRFPLTANGKLDRRALPEPGKPVAAAVAVAPRSALEELLVAIWKDVLQIEAMGIEDNFFSLGGDSLLAFQVVARLRKAGVTLTIPQLFAHQTVAALARVARLATDEALPPAAAPAAGEVALTPIQRWFFARELGAPHHFNQSVLLELRAPLEPRLLAAALARLVAHHDGLRLRFHRDGGAWRQRYAAPDAAARLLDIVALADDAGLAPALSHAGAEVQRSLDLAHGPLLRAVLFDLGAGAPDGSTTVRTGRLLVVAHHLLVDGLSWRILLEDLAAIYNALAAGAEPVLAAVTASYQAWSAALTDYATGAALAAEAPYWHALVAGGGADLPITGDVAGNTEASVRTVSSVLSADDTQALLARAPAAYRTRVDDLLLTALAHTLCEWTGRTSAVINLENHGREPLFDHVDPSRTVGWFTASHPLRLTPAGDAATSIKHIKEQLRAVPHRGIGYSVLRYLAGDAALSGPPPQLTFNYLGQFDQVFDDAAPFRPAAESAGEERDPAGLRDRWFDVIGMVEGKRLHIDWHYSPALHAPQVVARLAERYLHHLRALIAHCTDPAHHGLTPSDVPLAGLSQLELDALVAAADLYELGARAKDPENAGLRGRESPLSVLDVLPLTPIQEGILFHCLADPAGGLYITQRTIELDIAVDLDALRAAWQQVTASHDVLRTGFVVDGVARPLQIVWRDVEVPVERVDLRHLPATAQADELDRVLAADRARGFDLACPPLMRVTLLWIGPARYRLIWTDHHLLLDGWSSWRVLSEVLTRYQALARGEQLPLARTAPTRDYIAWLASHDQAQAEAFWRVELATVSSATRLAPQLARDLDATGFAREELELSAAGTERLKTFAQARSLTLNTVVQGAVALVIAAYTGKDDVVFGVTVSGRSASLPGVDEMVGLFINTLALRVQIRPGEPVVAWLHELQTHNAAMREHEHTPLMRAQHWSGAPRGGALFDTLLVFENYPIDRALAPAAEQLGIGAVSAHERTNYPLTLEVAPGDRLRLQLDCDLGAVGRAAARELIARIARTLEQLADAGDRRVAALSLITADERRALAGWNHTATPLPSAASLHAAFEACVDRDPDAVAIVDRDRRASYRELDARASQLAWQLIDAGVGPESLVAICAPRSIELVVGLLGILKAGAAYLPLDPEYPAPRIAHMLGDARPAIILAGAAQRDSSWGRADNVWELAAPPVPERAPAAHTPDVAPRRPAARSATARASRGRPPARTVAAQLAYCIYTSGSTGVPKGVTVSHENLLNFLAAMASRLEITTADSFLVLTSLSFDIAALELWLPLTRGARIVLAEREEAADAERLLQRLADGSVTVVQATPTTWRTLARRPAPVLPPRCKLLCGGEALPPDLAARLLERAGRVVNVYGPTETTVWSTLHVLDANHPAPSIGRPLDNTSIYVLDASLRPVPPGVTGELYIGGLGLARGYLRRPALTAERFLPDPFDDRAGARMYRTGDLARHHRDGTLDCLGRTDDQIKLRGHRIELGEIETRLRAQPHVAHAAVAARPTASGEPQLVAYVVADRAPGAAPPAAAAEPGGDTHARLDAAALEAALRAGLRAALPEPMLPQRYVFLRELPRTANGKLDRKALPAPTDEARAPHVAPRDAIEQALAELWSQRLGRAGLGVHDDFFALGGDSLVALQVVAAARGLGLALTPRDLFEHPTIAQLAAHITASPGAGPRDPASELAIQVLPPALAGRLDALTDPQLAAVAESRLVELPPLGDPAVLEHALRALERHHDALRLRVRRDGDQLRGSLRPPSRAPLVGGLAATATSAAHLLERAHDDACHRLDLEHGPLVYATWATWLDREARADAPTHVLVTAHVLAVDPASWLILLDDLQLACRQLAAGATAKLPPPTGTLQRWLAAGAGASLTTSPSEAAPAAHRPSVEAGASPTGSSRAAAPTAQRPSVDRGTRDRIEIALDEPTSAALSSELLQRHRAQPDEVVLAALAAALGRGRHGEPHAIGLESAIRRVAADGVELTRMIGGCTAPRSVLLQPRPTAVETLDDVARQLASAPAEIPRRDGVPANGAAAVARAGSNRTTIEPSAAAQGTASSLPRETDVSPLARGADIDPGPRGTDASSVPHATAASSLPRETDVSPLPRQASASSLPRETDASSRPRQASASSLPRETDASSRPRQASASPLPRGTDASSLPRGTDASSVPHATAAAPLPREIDASSVLHGAAAAPVPRAQPEPSALVRYLGAIDPAHSVLAAPLAYPLVVTCTIRRGRLAITLDHEPRAAAYASELLARLVDELGRIARELAATTPRSLRPDDFAHVQIDAAELQDLLEDLS